MLQLFNNTFKYGFNCKVKVKFEVKYEKLQHSADFAPSLFRCDIVYIQK